MTNTFFLSLLLLFSCPSFAEYLDPRDVDYVHLLPGPPSEHSSEYKEDFRLLHEWQEKRTSEECETAQSEGAYRLELFQKPRGPLTSTEVKKAYYFFVKLSAELQPIWSSAKKHWKRPRPYLSDSTLKPCPGMYEKSYAYPSGHTIAGDVFGKILADLFPDRANALIARGEEIGDHRIVGGVHHPTDVRDGRILADRMIELLYRNGKFKSDLRDLKRFLH